MDVYKLQTTEWAFKKVERSQFELDTGMDWPYYRPNVKGTMSQFAVCPICCNPIQIIHLYPDKADDLRPPYGKHIKHDLEGLATYSQESYDACPYANPTRHDSNARRHESTISSGILYILQEQYDRVIYLLSKDTGISISDRLAEAMLEQYIANKGHTFVYSTPMNIPWMLAYRGGKHGLFGRKIADELLRESILKHEPHAYFNERNQLMNLDGHNVSVSFCFVNYSSKLEDNALNESMDIYVTQRVAGELDVIYRRKLIFDHDYFQNLTHLPVDHPSRRMNLVEIARKLIQA